CPRPCVPPEKPVTTDSSTADSVVERCRSGVLRRTTVTDPLVPQSLGSRERHLERDPPLVVKIEIPPHLLTVPLILQMSRRTKGADDPWTKHGDTVPVRVTHAGIMNAVAARVVERATKGAGRRVRIWIEEVRSSSRGKTLDIVKDGVDAADQDAHGLTSRAVARVPRDACEVVGGLPDRGGQSVARVEHAVRAV